MTFESPSGTIAAQAKKLCSRMTFENPSGTAAAQAKNYAPDGLLKALPGPQLHRHKAMFPNDS